MGTIPRGAPPRQRVLLLTGGPGVGKTTLVCQAASRYRGPRGGFYTQEVRQGGVRVGFDVVTLDGRRAPLARAGLPSPVRVGKYGVTLKGLEALGVPALLAAVEAGGLAVVDEIGKMELTSAAFREAVAQAVERGRRVLGTVMLAPHPWADALKADPRVAVVMVSRDNRNDLLTVLEVWLREGEDPVEQA